MKTLVKSIAELSSRTVFNRIKIWFSRLWLKNTGKNSCFLILKTKIQIEFKYRNQGWNNCNPFLCFENKNVLPLVFYNYLFNKRKDRAFSSDKTGILWRVWSRDRFLVCAISFFKRSHLGDTIDWSDTSYAWIFLRQVWRHFKFF